MIRTLKKPLWITDEEVKRPLTVEEMLAVKNIGNWTLQFIADKAQRHVFGIADILTVIQDYLNYDESPFAEKTNEHFDWCLDHGVAIEGCDIAQALAFAIVWALTAANPGSVVTFYRFDGYSRSLSISYYGRDLDIESRILLFKPMDGGALLPELDLYKIDTFKSRGILTDDTVEFNLIMQ